MRIKYALKKFAYETFRPRSRADYAEVFSRGNGEGTAPYPWFYSRVFLLCFFLFSLLGLGYVFTELNFLALAFAGGFFADVVFVVLLYELYPKRDFSPAAPLAALFIGGLIASAAAYIIYSVERTAEPYHMQAWTAFAEETAKAVAVIFVVFAFKKKNAYACLVLGAAVGGGFSAFENMWYAFTEGFAYNNLSDAMQTILIRSLGTPFSHAAWTGAFGWAVSGDKPYKKWQPYAVFAFNYLMHFFVNFPLMEQFRGWKGYPVSAATGVASLFLLIILIVLSRREILPSGEKICRGLWETARAERLPQINSRYAADDLRFPGGGTAANVFAAVAILCLSFALMGPALMFRGYLPYKYYDFDRFEDCRFLVQNGLEFYPDYDRKYADCDPTSNFSATFSEGKLTSAVQREKSGEYFYRYRYEYRYYLFTKREGNVWFIRVDGQEVAAYEYLPESNGHNILNGFEAVILPDEEGEPDYENPDRMRRWELQSVSLEYEGGVYRDYWLYDDGRMLHTFILDPMCYSVYVTEDGKYRAVMDERVPQGKDDAAVFTAVFASFSAVGGAVYLILKFKSRRYKYVE